jgi:hypothetical protein
MFAATFPDSKKPASWLERTFYAQYGNGLGEEHAGT